MGLLSFFIGSLAGLYLAKDFSFCPLFIGACFLLVGVILSNRQKSYLALFFGLAFGVLLALLRFIPYPDAKEIKGIVIEAKNNYYILFDGFHKYYVSEKNCSKEVGDVLLLKGNIEDLAFKTYESRFDFKTYLENSGVFRSFLPKRTTYLFRRPLRFREREASLISSLSKESAALLDAVMFGKRDISSSSLNLASNLGLISILSSSGIIYGCILRSLEKVVFQWLDEKASKRLTLVFGSVFLFFSPWKIGVLRSYMSRLLTYLNRYKWNGRFIHLEILSIIGLFLIVINASNAYQTSFLLGFGISVFLYLSKNIVIRNKRDYRALISFILVYLVIFPMTLTSGEVHFLLPFFSSSLIPLVSIFAILGWSSFLSVPLTNVLGGYGFFLSAILKAMAKLDFSLSIVPPSAIQLVIYYLSLFVILYFLTMRHIGMIRNIAIANLALYVVFLVPVIPACTQEVSFINVGQGDSILIRDGFHAALLDTGGNISFDMAKEVLIPYLKKKRIYRLDYVIASHGDFDHIGAKDSLLANFEVGEFVDSNESFPLTLGEITMVNYNTYGLDGENDKSLVIGCVFMDKKWLFMGDAPEAVEKMIIRDNPDLDCDILKAGHHGSKTSSSYEFLKTVTPETAIISVGYKNHYGHPDKVVMDRMESLGIKTRRTDEEGTITYQKLKMPKL